jgi:hypothetical protein
MFRMAWRVNRKTRRERPFRPRLGGCLLWFLILIAIVLVLALFLGGVRKGTRTSPPLSPVPVSLAVALTATTAGYGETT